VEGILLLTEMAQAGRAAGSEEFIIAGDVFHLVNPTSYIRTLFNSFLAAAKEMGYKSIILIVGNHDASKTGAHALAPTAALCSWVTVVDQPSACDRFVYAPHAYFKSEEESEKYWSFIWENAAGRYLLGHLQVEKARSGVEEILLGGTPLSIAKLPDCRGAMLGHVHLPQEVTRGIHYIGSPRCMDFGERNEQKRYLLMDFEKGSMQPMIPQTYYKYLQYDLAEADIEAQDWSEAKDCIVKVKVTAAKPIGTHDIRKALVAAGAAHINSVSVEVERELIEKSGGERLTPMDAVKLCLEGHEQKEALLQMAQEIMKEAAA
jgi:DNA repair exonuclease SbcCD nuclease subunit